MLPRNVRPLVSEPAEEKYSALNEVIKEEVRHLRGYVGSIHAACAVPTVAVMARRASSRRDKLQTESNALCPTELDTEHGEIPHTKSSLFLDIVDSVFSSR